MTIHDMTVFIGIAGVALLVGLPLYWRHKSKDIDLTCPDCGREGEKFAFTRFPNAGGYPPDLEGFGARCEHCSRTYNEKAVYTGSVFVSYKPLTYWGIKR